MEFKKVHVPAEASGAPTACAPRNFEIFVQAAVKGFLAMNKPTQSLSARNQGSYETTRVNAVRLGVPQLCFIHSAK